MPTRAPRRKHPTASDLVTEVFRRLADARQVVYDAETSGLDWRTNHVCGHVLTFSPDPRDSFYLPVRHKARLRPGDDGNLLGCAPPADRHAWDGSLHPIESELIRLLDHQDLLVVGHNLNFDLRFLMRLGLKLEARFEDTIINAPLLDEFQPKFSLEYCANRASVAAKKYEQIVAYLCSLFPEAAAKPKGAMGYFHELAADDPVAVEYATGDGTSTWQLCDWQRQRLAEQDLGRVHDVESRLIPVLARMSVNGIRIDEERLDALLRHIGEETERLSAEFPPDFNVRSNPDVVKWMTDHGCTDWPMTAGGVKSKPKPSMKEEWLETHEAGRMIVKVRKFETLRTTFAEPMKNAHLWRGRVHTTFNQLRSDQYGTITGRLSSSDPNLQAVPKHNEEMGRLFRSIFVPDPGLTWGERDWSQMEPRLLAYYSRCRVLLDGYAADPPIDAHGAASAAMCGPRWEAMTDAERKQYRNDIGKRANQLIITGGGSKAMAHKYGLTEKDSRRIFADYFRAMPEVKCLQKHAAARMRVRGYVLSLLGRRARLNDDRDYTAVNRLLQCGNADAIKDKMVEIDDYLASEGRPIDMLLNCHDALDFQFAEEDRRHYDECVRIMGDFSSEHVRIKLDVPITTDGDEGGDWALATYGPAKRVEEPKAVRKGRKK